MSFSVVILSKTPSNLLACLRAIGANETNPTRIIVDDGIGLPSPWPVNMPCTLRDAQFESMSGFEQFEGAYEFVVKGVQPFVFSRNANIGLRFAFESESCDSVILCNDDAQLKTLDGLSYLDALIDSNPEYGILSAVTNSIGNLNQTPRKTPLQIRPEQRMLCFVCVCISRACWERVGPLDEDFAAGYGWEDNAYCEAVKAAGLKLGIVDGCFVDHKSLPSTFRTQPGNRDDFFVNRKIFVEKWGEAAAK